VGKSNPIFVELTGPAESSAFAYDYGVTEPIRLQRERFRDAMARRALDQDHVVLAVR